MIVYSFKKIMIKKEYRQDRKKGKKEKMREGKREVKNKKGKKI